MLLRKFLVAVLALVALSSTVFCQEQVIFWAMGEEGMRIGKSEILKRFEKENPNIKVIVQTIPWDAAREKLLTSVIGAIPPDVCQLGTTWMSEFSAMDALQDISGYMKNSSVVKQDAYFQSSWTSCVYKNKVVGVPWYVDTRVLFYRKDLLRTVGFSSAPKTWDELYKVSKALSKPKAKIRSYAISLPTSNFEIAAMFAWQNGANVLNADNTAPMVESNEFKDAMDFYARFLDEGLAPKEDAADVNIFNAFKTGFYSMFISGPWMLNLVDRYCGDEFKGKWDVSILPAGKAGPISFVGGANLVMFRDSKHKAAAWKLLEFLSKPDVQVEWYKINNNLPSLKAAWNDSYFATKPMVQVFGEQLKYTQSPPNIPEWEQINSRLGRHIEEIVIGMKDIDSEMAIVSSEIKKMLFTRTVSSTLGKKWLKGAFAGGFVLLFLLTLYFIHSIKKGKGKYNNFKQYITPYIFIAPVIVVLIVFLIIPVILSFLMSLTDWNVYTFIPGSKINFIGLQNYIDLFSDKTFIKSLFNTIYFLVVGAPISVLVSLLFALLLNEGFVRMRNFFRLGYFLPVVTTIVAVAVIWRWIYNYDYGLMNYALSLFNIPGKNWLESMTLAMPSLILMSVWKNFGYNMVIFLAGLQAIPEQLYEAARIDGAGRFQIFRHITLPSLAPTTFFITILTLIGYFQFFAEPYIMTKGGPRDATISIVQYMYSQGFKFLQMGYASAIAYVLFALIFAVTIFQMWMRKRSEQV